MKKSFLILGIIGALIAFFGSIGTLITGFGATGVGVAGENTNTANAGVAVFWTGALSFFIGLMALITSIVGNSSKTKNNFMTFALVTLVMGLTSIYLYNWVSGFLIALAGLLGFLASRSDDTLIKSDKPIHKSVVFIIMAVITLILVGTSILFKNMDEVINNDPMKDIEKYDKSFNERESANKQSQVTQSLSTPSEKELYEKISIDKNLAVKNNIEIRELLHHTVKVDDIFYHSFIFIGENTKNYTKELVAITYKFSPASNSWSKKDTQIIEEGGGRNAINLSENKGNKPLYSNREIDIFSFDGSASGQGELTSYYQLYAFDHSNLKWRDIGSIIYEANNSGSYEEENDPRIYRYTSQLIVDDTKLMNEFGLPVRYNNEIYDKSQLDTSYPKIIVKKKGTDFIDGKVQKAIDADYIYSDNRYHEAGK